MSLERWQTRPWRQTPRYIDVVKVDIDNDDVLFVFVDSGRESVCSTIAFARTYERSAA